MSRNQHAWGSDVYHRPDPETDCPVVLFASPAERLSRIEKYRRLVIKAAQQCDPALWNQLQELSNFLWELQGEDR